MFGGKITRKVLTDGAKVGIPFVLAVALVGVYFYRAEASHIERTLTAEAVVSVTGMEAILEDGILAAATDLRFLEALEQGVAPDRLAGSGNLELCCRFLCSKTGYDELRLLAGDGAPLLALSRVDGTVREADCDGDAAAELVGLDGLWRGDLHIVSRGGDRPGVRFLVSLGNEEAGSVLVIGGPVEGVLYSPLPCPESRAEIMILDDAGRRLDSSGAGGADYRAAHAREWAAMSRGEAGTFRDESGLYAYAALHPVRVVDTRFSPGYTRGGGAWKVVARIPGSVAADAKAKLVWNLLLFFLPLVLFLVVGALVLARLAEDNRRGRNELLEQHVSRERFVPSEFLKLMGKENLRDVDLSTSVERDIAILFSDIRAYTTLSEGLTPPEVFELLNSYFSSIDTAITARHGFIDKFIGDAVMALFAGSVEDALNAAVAMRHRIDQFNAAQRKAGKPEIATGFGLHYGEVTLGSVGTMRRMQTTAIGDAVNLASRLESATKIFKVAIIISDALYDRLKDPSKYRLRLIDTVRVKGKGHPVRLYEAYDTDSPELAACKDACRESFARAMEFYAAGDFDGALELFTACRDACPEDSIPPIYIKRCNTLKRVPPGEGWTGISTL